MVRPKRQKTQSVAENAVDQQKPETTVGARDGGDQTKCSNGTTVNSSVEYLPKLCLRSHCKHNDPFDNSTPIWSAAFQPPTNSEEDGNRYLATCGANMVCIIDCLQSVERCDKSVIARYIDSNGDEEFASLAWSPLSSAEDGHVPQPLVLAVGGKNTIILMSNFKEFHCFERVAAHSDQINALLFIKANLLFSGSYDRSIKLWQISRPNDNNATQLLKSIDTKQYLLSLSYSQKFDTLLASGEKGVFFWFRPSSESQESSLMKTKYLVDGLKVIGDDQDSVAIRIHMTRYITIIDLKKAFQEVHNRDTKTETKPILLSKVLKAKLESFDTEYPFIYLSAYKNLLVSGGPSGQIWLYDWDRISKSRGESSATNQVSGVDRILEWPLVENIKKDDKMVIDDKKPVIVNMVAISPDLRFLVACTSINLICIWHKAPVASTNGSNDQTRLHNSN